MTHTADDSVPELIRSLTGGRASTAGRLNAIHALGRLGDKARAAVPCLLTVSADEDAKIRVAAAQALGLIGQEATAALAQLLTHADKYVRRHATWGLGKLGPRARRVLRELCRTLKDADPRTAAGAAQALGAMGEQAADAVPALAEAMRGTNVVLCRLAAKALSDIGPPALPILIQHLTHHDPFVRGEAAVAVGWIGPAAAAAVPHLTSLLVAPATSGYDPPISTGSKSEDVTDFATPEDNARTFAAQSLGRIGRAAAPALQALAAALNDPHPAVCSAAQLAIKQIRGSSTASSTQPG